MRCPSRMVSQRQSLIFQIHRFPQTRTLAPTLPIIKLETFQFVLSNLSPPLLSSCLHPPTIESIHSDILISQLNTLFSIENNTNRLGGNYSREV